MSQFRNHAYLSVTVFACFLTHERVALATTSNINGLFESDTLGVYRGRTELSWLSDELGRYMLRFAAHGTTTGANELKGLGGGSRNHGGADATFIVGLSPIELRIKAGFENVLQAESWLTEGKLTLAPKSLSGFTTSLLGASKWLDGWFTYAIRSSSMTAAVNYTATKNWAELGGIWDERSSPRQPDTTQALDLRNNRIASLYSWYSHGFADWLMLGTAAVWADSKIDYHQPVSTDPASGILRYSDYPYPTPHSEGTWSALAELRFGVVKFKGTWPIFSQGSYRVEDPYSPSPYYYYQARWRAQSELRAAIDAPLSKTVALTVEAFALSRPYRSAAWFTSDAWNQFGLNLTLGYKTPMANP